MDLAEKLYTVTSRFPSQEEFGLKGQIRRCAVSVPSNIAEGSGRKTPKDFTMFLHIARGSLRELETQVELSMRIGYITRVEFEELESDFASIGRLLTRLIQSLRPN